MSLSPMLLLLYVPSGLKTQAPSASHIQGSVSLFRTHISSTPASNIGAEVLSPPASASCTLTSSTGPPSADLIPARSAAPGQHLAHCLSAAQPAGRVGLGGARPCVPAQRPELPLTRAQGAGHAGVGALSGSLSCSVNGDCSSPLSGLLRGTSGAGSKSSVNRRRHCQFLPEAWCLLSLRR